MTSKRSSKPTSPAATSRRIRKSCSSCGRSTTRTFSDSTGRTSRWTPGAPASRAWAASGMTNFGSAHWGHAYEISRNPDEFQAVMWNVGAGIGEALGSLEEGGLPPEDR